MSTKKSKINFSRLIGLALLNCFSLTIDAAEPAVQPSTPHWTQREHPGETAMDMWGWDFSTEHYRYVSPHHAGPKETRMLINDAADWGSNTLDVCYGFYPIGNALYAGHGGSTPVAGVKRGQGFWTLQDSLDFNRELHRRGMTVHWIPNSMWLERPDYKDFIDSMGLIASTQMDATRLDRDQIIDGMGMEQMWLFPPNLAARLFQAYNPGAYIYALETPGWPYALPNLLNAMATGGAPQDFETNGKQLGRGNIKPNGMEFMTSQIEAIELVGLDGQCSLARPDWVQKSLHDTLRPSYLDSRNKSYSAFWYVMAPNLSSDGAMSPDAAWRAKAMSIDPIRLAWAGKLDATGSDGRKQGFRRLELPSSTAYVQNNYLRLYVFPEKSGGRLLYDPQRTAYFEKTGKSIVLAEDFMETVAGTAPLERDLYPTEFTFDQPGGFCARMQSKARWLTFKGLAMKSEEKRTYSTTSDVPYIRVQSDFFIYGAPNAYGRSIKIPQYDQIKVGQALHTTTASLELPEACVLFDSTGKVPPLGLMITSTKPAKIDFHPRQNFMIAYGEGGRKHSVDVLAVVLDGLYSEKDLPDLSKALREAPEERELAASETLEAKNPYDIPVIKLMKVTGLHEHPYLVQENGWWLTRGAQMDKADPQSAYLKLYLPPNGSARFRPYDYIEGALKPGWGCQYTLAIRDVQPDPPQFNSNQPELGTKATIQVMRVTPMIFAPRVEFSQPIAWARLDGKPWHYFDDNALFLPNRPATYAIEVGYGHAQTPHVTRSVAAVEATEWDGRTLKVKTALPPWIQSLPEDAALTAAIKYTGLHLNAVNGCELLRQTTATASIVRFEKLGEFSVDFATASVAGAPQSPDFHDDLAAWLSREQARDVTPWLGKRAYELVNVSDVDAVNVNLARFGALIYNQFYLDEIPKTLNDPKVLQPLRQCIEGGGGLLLLSRAAPLATMLGIEQTSPTAHWISPHSLNYSGQDVTSNSYGLVLNTANVNEQMFKGLQSLTDGWLPIAGIRPMGAIRTRGWTSAQPPQQGRVVADFRLDSTTQHKPSPAMGGLVEWTAGSGRVLALSSNMVWDYTDRSSWPGTEYRLVENVINDPKPSNSTIVSKNGMLLMRNMLDKLGAGDKPVGIHFWR